MFALAMNAAKHRSQLALLSFVSPRAAVLLTPGTDFRRRRNSGRPYDRSTVVSLTYKLLTLSKKRSPSNSTDYKLPGEGAILLFESKCTALSGLSHPESTLASILPQPVQFQHLCKNTRGGYPPRPYRPCSQHDTNKPGSASDDDMCGLCIPDGVARPRDLVPGRAAGSEAPVTSLPSEASAKEGHQPALRSLGEGGSPACPPKPRRRRVTSLPSEASAKEGHQPALRSSGSAGGLPSLAASDPF